MLSYFTNFVNTEHIPLIKQWREVKAQANVKFKIKFFFA
jgi:hypothetical protein